MTAKIYDGLITRKLILTLLPVQILSCLVGTVNTTVDNLVASQLLGTTAMAAIGLFSPINQIAWIDGVILVGTGILCGKAIGSGNVNQARRIFAMGVNILVLLSCIIAGSCLLFPTAIAAFMGASGISAQLLVQYMIGYAPGFIGQMLIPTIMQFLVYNGENTKAFRLMLASIVLNAFLDTVCVATLGLGIFGLGLATTVSNTILCGFMAVGFLDKRKLIHYQPSGFELDTIKSMLLLGAPTFIFTIGLTIRLYVTNNTLMSYAGIPAMVAMSLQGNTYCILDGITSGIAAVTSMMASVYYGERDKESLVFLLKNIVYISLAITVLAAVGIILGSAHIADFYCGSSKVPAWNIMRHMLILFPLSAVIGGVVQSLTKLYQVQGEMTLVNGVCIFEHLFLAAFVAVMVPLFGTDAAWIAFPITSAACLLIYAISVFKYNGGITFKAVKWLKLPKDFTVGDEDRLAISISTLEEVENVSQQIMDFCKEKGFSDRKSYYAGLCMEEMASNIVLYGFVEDEENSIDIRCIYENDAVTIRMRDDCREFNPIEYAQTHDDPDDPERNLGIRLVKKVSKEMNYQCNIKHNTLSIVIDK